MNDIILDAWPEGLTELTHKILDVAELGSHSPNRADCVMTKGAYDVLHLGHVHSFIKARDFGSKLIVAVATDSSISARKGPTRPINTLANRMAMVASIYCVSHVTWYNSVSPFGILNTVRPGAFVASNFDSLTPEEQSSVKALGIRLCPVPKPPLLSTSEIIDRLGRTDATVRR